MNTTTVQKKKKEFPHTYVLLICVALIACLLTYVIPAGEYAREKNAAGVTVVIPDQFSYIESSPVNPLKLPLYIAKGCASQAAIIFMILMAAGAFKVIEKSGCFHAVVGLAARKFAKREYIFIPLMMTVFAAIGLTQSATIFVAFTPICVILAKSMGFDSITGAAISTLGAACGYSCGMLHPQSTLIAQDLAELPRLSGLGYRGFCTVAFLALTSFLLVRYARRVRTDHTLSPVYDLEDGFGVAGDSDESLNVKLTGRQLATLLVLVCVLGILIYGCINLKWSNAEISMCFIWLAVIGGLTAGFSANEICKHFSDGAKGMISMVFIIGIAKAVSNILADASVLDTIVHATTVVLNAAPDALKGVFMFWANIIINIPLTSSSGQAQVVMPIFVPVADMVGITRQTAVLSYNFGDGFCNYILPWSGALMANIGVANVPYDRWMRFMWKMFAAWTVLGSILMFIAQMINFGPF